VTSNASSRDEKFMNLALRLAERGRGKTSPNPMVGAVIVKGEEVVGAGWHRSAGSPHAEVLALEEAGSRARGGTLYVSLEPCSHQGRTPPCADLVAEAGLRRVVVAMADPDPRVSGRGMEILGRADIDLVNGVMEQPARKLNEAYVVHRTEMRPFVTYKAAITLDGKTAADDGSSKWISGSKARLDVQRMRARSDAICVGSGTVLADDPSLTVRDIRTDRHPLRVVIDTEARALSSSKVLAGAASTLFLVGEGADAKRVDGLAEAGAEVVEIPRDGAGISLKHAAERLAARNIVSMLLEGGPRLAAGFEAAGLIDKYVLYVSPKLLGSGNGLFEGWSLPTIDHAKELVLESMRRMGPDIRIVARSA
jgi:diaminohydroxyphosphoribosylaminopyrimidine deaminase/5-amino-6-(5-phosphoribosylamino)uracil reductase